MIIYLVILPEDQQVFARKDYHLIQNRFYDKKTAIDFLNQNKNKYPTAKIVIAELSPESSQYHKIYGPKITFPANSVIKIDENPNLEQNQLDMAEIARRIGLNASRPLDEGLILNRAAAHSPGQHDREALLLAALERLMAQPGINRANPVQAAAHVPSPHDNREAMLRAGLVARLGAQHPNRIIPAAAASPSPVQEDRREILRPNLEARNAAPSAPGLPDSLVNLKATLMQYLIRYIQSHPKGEQRREYAKLSLFILNNKGEAMNPEQFRAFLMDMKKEIEKTPDHKASGLWRLFEEIIKKIDLQLLAVQNPNNLVTQRFPFINESHIGKARQLDLVDPVSGSIMENPVKILPSGKYYDKSTIDNLKTSGAPFICPLTRQPITKVEDAPEKKKEIEAFLQNARGNQLQPEALIPPQAPPPSSGNKPR